MYRAVVLCAVVVAACSSATPEQGPWTEDARFCLEETEHPEAIIDACTRALQSGRFNRDDSAVLLRGRAAAYFLAGRYGDALIDYESVLQAKLSLGSEIGVRTSHCAAMLRAMRYADTLSACEAAIAVFNRLESELGLASSVFTQFVERAHLVRGQAYLRLGDSMNAVSDFESALFHRPSYITNCFVALGHQQAGKLDDAKQQLAICAYDAEFESIGQGEAWVGPAAFIDPTIAEELRKMVRQHKALN